MHWGLVVTHRDFAGVLSSLNRARSLDSETEAHETLGVLYQLRRGEGNHNTAQHVADFGTRHLRAEWQVRTVHYLGLTNVTDDRIEANAHEILSKIPKYSVVTRNCHEFVTSLVKMIILPGFYLPTTLANTLGVRGSSAEFERVNMKLVLKLVFSNLNLFSLPQLKLCRYIYKLVQRKPLKTLPDVSCRCSDFEDYFLLEPSDAVPEQTLAALQAVVSCGIIAKAALELELCLLQQPKSKSSAILDCMIQVLAAQQEWNLPESTETSEAVRQFIKELKSACFASKIVLGYMNLQMLPWAVDPSSWLIKPVISLLFKPFVVYPPFDKFRKRVTSLGERITDSLDGCDPQTLGYLSPVENILNELRAADAELRILKRQSVLF